MSRLIQICLVTLFCFGLQPLLAQPANDECNNPINITNVLNWCSAAGAYTNVGATPSTYGPATCFGGTTYNDIWFTFTAQATDVTITIRGATNQAPGGTLSNPQISLYLGACGGTINQLECQSAPAGADVVEAYQGGLFVGAQYFFRIQGAGGATGTFQICINNYNPPVDPESDCPKAAILCDKSPFVVQAVTGAGSNINEMDDALCFSNGAPTNNESNSTWFVWECGQSGTLEFTLTPLNAPDDLDFVVYRLPNGLANCSGKEVLRCMASGDFTFPSPCMGPTGLKAGAADISESAGCGSGKDNFLAPLQMVQGEVYALAINNFTTSGNGFNIEFGGTGEFLGPTVDFNTIPNAICLDASVQLVDASTFALGNITSYKWSFGIDATPQTAAGIGPHTVSFSESGQHPIVLTIETNLGCRVTDIENVTVYPDVVLDTIIGVPDCNGGTNGSISVDNIQDGTPPYQYSWDGGAFSSNNMLSGLPVGIYNLKVKDANNCETELDISVQEKTLTVEALVTRPLCFGDDNGVIALLVTNGTPVFQFDWGNGFEPNNTQSGFAAGAYTILGQDAELCKGAFNVTVTDYTPLELTASVENISCFGANDGTATAEPVGGFGNYTYLWSDGQTTKMATDLPPGDYTVTIFDGNECNETATVTIIEPADVDIRLLGITDLKCAGVPTGSAQVEGLGGVQPYTFSADGVNFFASGDLMGLLAGNYFILVRDAEGCVDSVPASILQPAPLEVFAEPADTTLNLGFPLQIRTVIAPSGRPVEILWTPPLGLYCSDCAEPFLTATLSTIYVIQIMDEDGCVAYDSVRIHVVDEKPIYAPNAIMPEKNYPNNLFTLFGGPAASEIELLQVYDRWGELIFETQNIALNDPLLGWDGTYKSRLMHGVFAWQAMVRFVDEKVLPYTGNVTVIR